MSVLKFFTKNEEHFQAKHLERALKRGCPRQVPRLPPLKHTDSNMRTLAKNLPVADKIALSLLVFCGS